MQAAVREQRAQPPREGRDRAEAFQAMQPMLAEMRTATQAAIAQAERILTAEQWSRVPEALKRIPEPVRRERREP